MPDSRANKDSSKKRRSSGKLKTYSAKKRSNAARVGADDGHAKNSDDEYEIPETQTQQPRSPRQHSPELGDPSFLDSHPTQSSQPPVLVCSTPRAPYEDPAEDAGDVATQATSFSSSRARNRVVRNRAFLDSLKKSHPRSQRASRKLPHDVADDEDTNQSSAAQELDDNSDEGLLTPPGSEQVSDRVKVDTWLGDEAAQGHGASASNHASNGVDAPSNNYGSRLRRVENSQGELEEPHEPEDLTVDKDLYTPQYPTATNKRKRKSGNVGQVGENTPAKKRARKSVGADNDSLAIDFPPSCYISVNPINLPTAGPFTPEEIDMVHEAFDYFKTSSGLTHEEMVNHIQTSSKEAAKVLTHLVNDILPNRNRKAIQRFCRRHYTTAPRGKWTPEQDELLRAAYAERPMKWTFIGDRVGRMPEDCRDRWRNFVSHGDTRHTDVWTREEELTLAKAIKDCISAASKSLGVVIPRHEEDDHISWTVVVQRMGGLRNRLQCTNKWKKLRRRNAQEERAVEAGNQNTARSQRESDKTAAKQRLKSMHMGDLYAILREIEYGSLIGNIDHKATFWGIVTKMHPTSPYTTSDRKAAYKSMCKSIDETGDFREDVAAMIAMMKVNFADKLHDRNFTERDLSTPAPNTNGTGTKRSSSAWTQAKTYNSAEVVVESDAEDDDVETEVKTQAEAEGVAEDEDDDDDANTSGASGSETFISATENERERTPVADARVRQTRQKKQKNDNDDDEESKEQGEDEDEDAAIMASPHISESELEEEEEEEGDEDADK